MKIFGTTILYNPDMFLLERINSYLNYIDMLFIIDNSEIKNSLLDNFCNDSKKCKYIFNNQNLGISKALNIALEYSFLENGDLLLTMDQDSSFYNESISIYMHNIKFFNKISNNLNYLDKIAIFAPNYRYSGQNISGDIFSNQQIVITSGSLINLKLAKKIGYFDENLFIDEVDHDYSLRAIKLGFKVIMFDAIPLNHKLGNPIEKKDIFGNLIILTGHSPLRGYYQLRNALYMRDKHKKDFPKITKSRLRSVKKHNRRAVIYGDQKIIRIKFLFKAIFDYIFNNFGKLK